LLTKERIGLVAPCGIDCGTCELYMCKDNSQLQNILVGKGIPKEKLPCPGFRTIKGACPVIGSTCETYLCASVQNVEYCFACKDFPCIKLHPAAHRAEILPHNLKVFNLCTIKRIGVAAFVEKSAEIKKRYYMGKMEIGNGPQLP
jgi:hypothetical protein